MPVTLVWFRTDLRVHDNTALFHASQRGPVIAVFLHAQEQWREHGHGDNKLDFIARGVEALGESLAQRNIPLIQLDTPTFKEAPEALMRLADELGADALYFNREYPLDEWQRDQAVLEAGDNSDLEVRAFRDAVAFSPGELLTGKGDYYGVFTPFSKAWHKAISSERLEVLDAPAKQSPVEVSATARQRTRYDDKAVDGRRWPAGEEAAADRLSAFLSGSISSPGKRYKEDRDFPAKRGTSELSPYLAMGMISWRQCMQAVISINDGSLSDGDKGLTTWVSELIWREFYQHVAVGFPRVCRYRAFQRHTEALEWRDADDDFAAWCEGRTGYPLVDAAMRQLVSTGWMHNRLRMVTAMFLTKHLLIDWRRGERFFLEHLVDGEFAANNGGWQWAASTGTDAAPYFRIFNPTTQSERFDPDGNFIAHWLPELADLPARQRHAPSSDLLSSNDYPRPIVEHKAARERALEAFKSLSKDD
ncbi:deoxyribodipyrimidine photo-lyase [Halomonas denitrificans]|uniref:deoxyribodipyrimidine photo-lyase n=1 Tax=Halomonas TaxID=2745 RepID=UPI001A8FE161|nr:MULTISPECIES: deoxyribodipyrimidine photo-lyase [Halomonas]MED5296315.1 deoxyribodipyrimidine photo-lyase [Pseudomonadota bacterium]MBN8414004.1 deoxyribodipyrimidine photo-lyase [Halomonas litopenaei]MBY5930242.1 deoxyribodipyrimidine photo-lyase [Halomonas sp. DP8Y7-3]MBY6028010.1 deoxyribodipyrimidine photo-lyase [Halomonas sp. DP8Y7-1]MCA0976577.1 deoxyribodipyrimidine photo-lyase [Halomonas denitrificans]